jgi:hypothetical protein
MGERVAGDNVQCLFRSSCQALVSILQNIVLAPLLNWTLLDLYFRTIPGSWIPARIPLTTSGPQNDLQKDGYSWQGLQEVDDQRQRWQ